jgi:anaerobic magnesium-protoporphyrin IX monomethyl ester cyclase
LNRVLFGQSYFLRFDPKLWQAQQPYPPLGTLFAAAVLRQHGYDVALFDAMLAESPQEWEQALVREQPQVAVLYEDNFNYLSKMCLSRMHDAALQMIRMARARGVTVVVCGSDATDRPSAYLDAGADYALVGEGDQSLLELMDRLSGRSTQAFEAIAGLVFRGRDATLVRSAPRPVLRDLDALPAPAWDLVDVERYRRLWVARHGYFSMNMVTTRGCPYHCNWCAKPIWGQVYNSRSPEHVVAELLHLKRTYRPDHVWFADDILGLQPGWLARFAERVEALEARVPFKCLSRVDLLLRPGEIDALQRAGCRNVWVGAESGSQRVLDAMEKGTRVEQVREATLRLRQAGIQVGFFLQFGYPGEGLDEIAATRRLVRECAPDEIGISVSYPLPGTRFHERVKEQLGEKRNWLDSADMEMMYRGPFDTRFYRSLYVVVQKEFARDLALRRLRALSWHELGPRQLRRMAALVYHTLTLPMARLRLLRRARLSAHGDLGLQPDLSPDEAAQPALPR